MIVSLVNIMDLVPSLLVPRPVADSYAAYLLQVKDLSERITAHKQPVESIHVLRRDEHELVKLADYAERGAVFEALVESTSTAVGMRCKDAILAYLRNAGIYEQILLNGTTNTEILTQEYWRAFANDREETVVHLVPLDRIHFPRLTSEGVPTVIETTDFTIRYYTSEELDKEFRNRARKAFYPTATVKTAVISRFPILRVEEAVPAYRAGNDFCDHYGNRLEPQIRPRADSPYPAVVEEALTKLALYDWRYGYVRGQSLTLSKILDISLPGVPNHPPIPDVLATPGDPPEQAADYYWEPRFPVILQVWTALLPPEPPPMLGFDRTYSLYGTDPEYISELATDRADAAHFDRFLKYSARLHNDIAPYQDAWGFLRSAKHFLLRGLTTEGPDRLLWYITAIEAILGEDIKCLTAKLAERVSRILSGDPKHRQRVYRAFKDCYKIRSRLVHGDAKKPVDRAEDAIFHAGTFARKVTLWALHFGAHVAQRLPPNSKAPRRDEFLRALDGKQTHPAFLDLPGGFPFVNEWLNDRSGHT